MSDEVPERSGDALPPDPSEATHPTGLYVLFATELWERFGFYSMMALFTLYLQDKTQGFGWTTDEATRLYSTYLMCVYAGPVVGGFLADRWLGHRPAVMMGGAVFVAGYLLMSTPSLTGVYVALGFLVVANGLFKPNVSILVGNLYPDGSPLKDRAFSIFYMGINIGAFLAPIVAQFMTAYFGFRPALCVSAFGMLIGLAVLALFKKHVEGPAVDQYRARALEAMQARQARTAAKDGAPPERSIAEVPESARITALIVIYAIAVVFWMVFYQNGSTLTYWAERNTAWPSEKLGGIISNAINPFWIVALTFPLVWLFKWLDRRGLEPSTPAKMAFGMLFMGLSFFVLYVAAKVGEASAPPGSPYAFRLSPMWLVVSYLFVSLGELLLSPMGLSLVTKVAPARMRGMMMGGWFIANSVGAKLTMIGIYWDRWLHSSFFAVLGLLSIGMGLFLFMILRPLKRAMPGV
ncbi:MAG: peptide MFS transporter [Candidatus Riflebacteria bacterium]|nr:peptide MFS transporter [Candidatus Riflebacteria bacterium]